ncbi:MAG: hypothetical protein IKI03_02075 [Clostridia bacterium]|nr:hypothetical protein [Clostridia bacterium]
MPRRSDDRKHKRGNGGFFKRRFDPETDGNFSSEFDFEEENANEESEEESSFASAFSDFSPEFSIAEEDGSEKNPEGAGIGAGDPPEEFDLSDIAEDAEVEDTAEEFELEDILVVPEAEEIPDVTASEEDVGGSGSEDIPEDAEVEEVPGEAEAAEPENDDDDEIDVLPELLTEEFVVPDEADGDENEPEIPEEETEAPEEAHFEKEETPGESSTGPMGSTDMNLRIAFGLEEEGEDAVSEKVKRLGDQMESDVRKSKPVRLTCPEYTDPMQAKSIAAAYKRSSKLYNFRLLISAILTLVLLIYENIPAITTLFGGRAKQFSGVLDPAAYPVVYTMVSLQILFIVCAIGFKEIKSGVRSLFLGAPDALSLTILPVFICTVHSVITSFVASSRFEPVLFNSVGALAVTLAIMSARLNNKREMMTFFVVGSRRDKYAMCRFSDDELIDDIEAFDGDEDVGDLMKIEKTHFIDSFFARTQAPNLTARVFIMSMMGISLVLAILAGVYHFVNSGKPNEALTLGALIAGTVVPMSAFVTYSYPFYRAAKAAKSVDSAIIGDVSLDEYAGASVVAFDDTNVFPSVGVKVQNIRIYNNARIDRVLYYAASAFSRAGGPLEDIFEIATMDMNKSDSVEIIDAADGYLATKIDGINITFGSYEELRLRGFAIDEEVAVDDVDFSGEMCIMYMIREDKLVSKLYIKYEIDTDIEPILRQFNDGGVYMCVRTYDPNINEDMIASKLEMKNPPVKVVRFREEGEVGEVTERADSGIVTTGSPKSLLQLIPYCDNTSRTKRDCMALGIVASVIAAIIVLLIFISGGISRVGSLLPAIYQLAWLLPAFLISKIFVR